MTFLIIYFCLAVCVSFLCSLLESVILSVTPAYIAVAVKSGKRSGRILNYLKKNMDRTLAAILTFNTVANTVGAAGVGAQVHQIYGDSFVAIGSAVLTFTILIFSEIIPKTLGSSHWKLLAPMCAYIIRALILSTYPFVLLSVFLSNRLSSNEAAKLTREEMIQTAVIGATEGAIRHKESRVIHNLLMLDRVPVSDVMTPRSVITAFNGTETVGRILEQFPNVRFSRIPLYQGDLDHIIGLLYRYKLMEASSQDRHDIILSTLKDPIHSIPGNISVGAALDQFLKRKEHLFLVVDEYGTTIGIVTLEDAIETLLGVEIVDETDTVEDMRQLAIEKWKRKKSKTPQS